MNWRALVLAGAVSFAVAPAAGARPVSLPYSEDFLAIAAGGGHALVAEPEPFGAKAIVIRDLDFAARTDHVLLEVPYSDTTRPDVALSANAGGYLVAIAGSSVRIVQGGYDGSQRTLLDCVPTREGDVRLRAGVAGFALAGLPCGPQGPVTVGADGALNAAGGDPAAELRSYAEPFVALQAGAETIVRDSTTGAERRVATGEPDAIAVTPDGTLLAITSDGLFAWRPDGTQALLSKRAGGGIATSGERAVFDTLSVPRIVPLSGGTAHAISIPGAGLASLLAFDGSSATFQSFSCRGERQLTRVAVDEPRTPGQIGECPVRFPARGLRFSARGDASVRVSCPNGCRADLRLAEQRGLCDFNGTSCRVIATAKLDLPASQRRRRVAFRLTPAGRRLRGRELDVRMTSRGGLGLTFYGEIRSVVLKD